MVTLKVFISVLLCSGIAWRIYSEYRQVNLRVLNHMLAGLSFKDLWGPEKAGKRDILQRYEKYFQAAALHLPNRPDAYAMEGFCQAKQGKTTAAIASYEKAASFQPPLVWIYYNLGVLYLKEKDIAKAKENFSKALQVPVEINLLFLRTSKIYVDVLASNPDIRVGEELTQTYTLSHYVLSSQASSIDPNMLIPRLI